MNHVVTYLTGIPKKAQMIWIMDIIVISRQDSGSESEI